MYGDGELESGMTTPGWYAAMEPAMAAVEVLAPSNMGQLSLTDAGGDEDAWRLFGLCAVPLLGPL
jgi:hypothetical protein